MRVILFLRHCCKDSFLPYLRYVLWSGKSDARSGLSVMHRVSWKDEWLAEAYMETDYSTLVAEDFQKTINDYLSYLVKEGHIYEA